MVKENSRILQLDGLRGLAVIFVVSFHYINNQISISLPSLGNLNLMGKILMKTTYFGWIGVDLFFVLSGFLIGSILLRNQQSPMLFKAFYIRRFARILPIYYLLLVVFHFSKEIITTPSLYMFIDDISLSYYFLFIQNFAMGYNNNFGPPSLTPTWSLAVEEQFYLIIPLVIFLLKPQHIKYFIAFCLCLAPVSRYFSQNWYQQYTLLTSRIDSPAVGLLLAYILQRNYIENFITEHLAKFRLLSLALIGVSCIIYFFCDVGVFNHTIIAVIFGLIILITIYTQNGGYYKFITMKPLLFVGGISYFVYLFHLHILYLFHYLFLDHATPQMVALPDIIATIAAFLVTLFLGYTSFKYIEHPLIAWSHRFKY